MPGIPKTKTELNKTSGNRLPSRQQLPKSPYTEDLGITMNRNSQQRRDLASRASSKPTKGDTTKWGSSFSQAEKLYKQQQPRRFQKLTSVTRPVTSNNPKLLQISKDFKTISPESTLRASTRSSRSSSVTSGFDDSSLSSSATKTSLASTRSASDFSSTAGSGLDLLASKRMSTKKLPLASLKTSLSTKAEGAKDNKRPQWRR